MDTLLAHLAELATDARLLAQDPAAPPGEVILRDLVDPLPFAALVANNQARYVVANRIASEMTGYSNRELIASSVWELTPPNHERDFEVLWRAFLEQREQRGDYRLLTKDGRTVSARYAARAHVLPGLHLSLLSCEPASQLLDDRSRHAPRPPTSGPESGP